MGPHARDEATAILHLNSGTDPTISIQRSVPRVLAAVPGLLEHCSTFLAAGLATNIEHPFFKLQLLLAGCRHIVALRAIQSEPSPGVTLARESFSAKSDYVARPLPPRGAPR